MTKRLGRPTKPAVPGTRVSLGLRVTPDIKTKLDEAARFNGRTQSQEAELRLESTFQDDKEMSVLEETIGRLLALTEMSLKVQLIQAGIKSDTADHICRKLSGSAELDFSGLTPDRLATAFQEAKERGLLSPTIPPNS